MPYVPPHLRNRTEGSQDNGNNNATSTSKPEYSPRGSSYGGGGGYSRGNDYNRSSKPSGDGAASGMSRNTSYGNLPRAPSYGQMPRNQSYGRGLSDEGGKRVPHEPNFIDWKPSERVQSLNDEQIAEIRQRLNVTVEVGPGQPPATSPIESFQEMVRTGMLEI